MNDEIKERFRGCLMGQLVGDALGAQVEFRSVSQIKDYFTNFDNEICVDFTGDGGTFGIATGQITDDSEMAIALASSIINAGKYDENEAMKEYKKWKRSNPFDIGNTILRGIDGYPNSNSLANGALMRVSPLAAFMWTKSNDEISDAAMKDCALTHPNTFCCELNALYAIILANLVKSGDMVYSYNNAVEYAKEHFSNKATTLIIESQYRTHTDFITHKGLAEIAFQNAIYCLLHKPDIEYVMNDTILSGGDTDTNAAIAGAMYGAFCGMSGFSKSWKNTIMQCMPAMSHVESDRYDNFTAHPRPVYYWPSQLMLKGETLIELSDNDSNGTSAS